MTNKELINVLYKTVCGSQPLSQTEQHALNQWRKETVGNEHSYALLTRAGGGAVRFREPHPLWVIVIWCFISLVLGAGLSALWIRERQPSGHPYATVLVDSAWQRIDRYARERGMVATYNGLGKLTFRMATDTADLLTPPATYKRLRMDSVATRIYQDIIVTWNSYLGMVITTISIHHAHGADSASGFADYEATFNYSAGRIGDPYLRSMDKTIK